MDKLLFFDLAFEGNDPDLEENFYNFFYSNGLTALFTDEHRAQSIRVSYLDAKSVVKAGKGDGTGQGKAYKILSDFANYVSMGQDNKSFQEAMFKILYESRTWPGFLKNIQEHMNYIDTIDSGYLHNTWNIVWYDKDKSGTKVSKGL